MDIPEQALPVDEVLGVQLLCVVSPCKLAAQGSKIKILTLGGEKTLDALPCFQWGELCQPEALQSETGLVLHTFLESSKAVDFLTHGVFVTHCATWLIP